MFKNSEGGTLSEDDAVLLLPGPEPVNSADEVPTAGITNSSSGKMSEDSYSLNGINNGAHKCHYTHCDKEFPTKQGLVNHSRVHLTDEQKNFLCPHPDCGKRYISKKGARYHYGIEHGDRSTWHQCLIAGCLSSFYERRALKLHQVEHGIYCCTGLGCDYRCHSEEDLSAHRKRNHTEMATLYKSRSSEARLNTKTPRIRQQDTSSIMFSEVGRNQCKDESYEENEEKGKDEEVEEEEEEYDEQRSHKNSFNYPELRNISRGWKCPAKGCKAYRKFKYNLHSHWQDKHPDLPEPSDIASMVSTVSDQSTKQHPASSLEYSHFVGESGQSPASGTSASTYRPVHHRPVHHEPAQMHSRQPWPNNIDSQRPSIQFKREEDDNNLGNYMSTGNINNSNAKFPTSTPSVTSSRSSMTAAVHARTSTNTVRSYNPSVPPSRHGAPTKHPPTAALVNPSGNPSKSSTNHPTGPFGNSSIPPKSHPANTSLTKTTTPAAHRAANRSAPKGSFSRATEARRSSPPPARSNQAARSTLISTNTNSPRNQVTNVPTAPGASISPSSYRTTASNVTRSQSRTRQRAYFRPSPSKSDNEVEEVEDDDDRDDDRDDDDEDDDHDDDDDEEEGLFVSPADKGTMQRGDGPGSNSRVLGVRGFANMPLPRDQDSDEEDLRPSHILRQERRAAAGKSPYYPPGARDSSGRPHGQGTMGMGMGSAADQFDDSDDDEFDNSLENTSSDDSFQENPPRGGRRSTNRVNTKPPTTKPHHPSTKPTGRQDHPDTPRTPSPTNTNPNPNPNYMPYQTYHPDLASPPPSRLIRSPNVLNHQLPYPNRPPNTFLSDIGVVQPSDLFDADDIFFTFRGPTARETELQQQFDAEKHQLRLNARGSGFRPPMHFDTCPHTAPISRLERAPWIEERLRLDERAARAHLDRALDLNLDLDAKLADAEAEAEASGADRDSGLPSRKRATCAGPARVKRKYTWKDAEAKNKRARRGAGAGASAGREREGLGARAVPGAAGGGGDEVGAGVASARDGRSSGS